jgi:1,4-alpha-glucan branching enzyme
MKYLDRPTPRLGYLAFILHAHLPYVRHPEHARFLEEGWLFEALTECYLPLTDVFTGWQRDGIAARLTLVLSPTLCEMLRDPLLQQRYLDHLDGQVALAEKECLRTHFQTVFNALAGFYLTRLEAVRSRYKACGGDLVGVFRRFQEAGMIDIIPCAATHAVLPLLAGHVPSLRAQISVARAIHHDCFGGEPSGFWLPECAYDREVEALLSEAGFRWFIVDTHGLWYARPRPRNGCYAPVITPGGLAAFGRDAASAQQVWSRHGGYPGDPRYREFYRDIGFDLDLDYVRPHFLASGRRGFTGMKYYRVSGGPGVAKAGYDRQQAMAAVGEQVTHFIGSRREEWGRRVLHMDRPPLTVAPYDAELFGHWWFEGPEFLDGVVRSLAAQSQEARLLTPGDYLRAHPENQVAAPAASSWGEGGYLQVWLNPKNGWIQRRLQEAGRQMSELVGQFLQPEGVKQRGLRQAGRELLLAQASDWAFMVRHDSHAEYARRRVQEHLAAFAELRRQMLAGQLDETFLVQRELTWPLFPDLDCETWRAAAAAPPYSSADDRRIPNRHDL